MKLLLGLLVASALSLLGLWWWRHDRSREQSIKMNDKRHAEFADDERH